jgi:hypothetical protein
MCRRIGLTHVNLPEQPFGEFLRQLRQSHDHGGAHLAAFEVSPDNIFDWFAARNRLSDEDLIDSLVVHPAIRGTLPDLAIPELNVKSGLTFADPFILDSRFAHCLHAGGAYWKPKENGKDAKTLALGVCEAMFGLRYGEIALIESSEAWTPWFYGIAWDLTEVVFDRRLRRLWLFAITDTD